MENYIFFHRTGKFRMAKADPSRPETWPFAKDEIKEVHQDCTELFLTPCTPSPFWRGGRGERSESQNLQKLLEAIADRYKEKLNVDFALQKMNMSKSRFHAFFRQETGMTFVAYINRVRVEHAARLLLETDLKSEAVGFDCGFDSPSHFYKCFKEHYGMSPARYRVACFAPKTAEA